jgi:DNA (cytosine-5)-methyltransferase 1
MGYYRAGFDVIGVDIKPQPHYPFKFVQADVMEYPIGGFDAIHASPPCQAFTVMRMLGEAGGKRSRPSVDLVDRTRQRLQEAGVPWIMENVVGAPLCNPLMLCGSAFGLAVRRHRLFESSHLIFGLPCDHPSERAVGVYGDHPQHQLPREGGIKARTLSEGQEAMGIDWMPWRSLTQAIPPAYTEWIGRQLLP